jgi:hypothetical protein
MERESAREHLIDLEHAGILDLGFVSDVSSRMIPAKPLMMSWMTSNINHQKVEEL